MSLIILISGLILFLGTHSIRIVADAWRARQRERIGEMRWKGLYSVASAIGLGLIVWGYGQARPNSPLLWTAATWVRHVVALPTLLAFIMLAAAYIPGTRIKAVIGHPMVAGVMLWAGAHLMANGKLSDAILFGGFLLWAIADFLSARRRDRMAARRYDVAHGWLRDMLAVTLGCLVWGLFAGYGHVWLVGVRPFG